MKAVLISIHPQWCELIASGKKKVEVRKTKPKMATPFKVHIYCAKDKKGWFHFGKKQRLDGMVIGEFVCDSIIPIDVPYPAFQNQLDKSIMEQSCLTYYQLHRYAYHDMLYGWHISDLKIYEKPKELSEFYKPGTLSNADFEYQLYDGSGDPRRRSYASYLCTQAIRRPPQSWCYVEEMLTDGN